MTFDPSKLSHEEKRKLQENIADLQKKYALFVRNDDLRVGDFVTFKPGLTNRRYPRPGTAGIVTRVFPVPLKDLSKNEAGSPYFNEELTISVGILDNDGDFVEFTYDGKRMEHADPSCLVGKHAGFSCDGCGARDFTGIRFHCDECKDFDLCARCHASGFENEKHSSSHKMTAIEPASADTLKERMDSLLAQECFQPGDIVQWKTGLKNKRLPKMDQLAVVVETLPSPVTDEDKSSSGSYFLEPLDIKLGMVDEDGDFVIFHFDSRRFTKAIFM